MEKIRLLLTFTTLPATLFATKAKVTGPFPPIN